MPAPHDRARRFILHGVLLTAALLALVAGSPHPCADARLPCPDLVMRKPTELHLLKGRYLAATNQIVNVGKAPAEIRARRIGATTMRGRQVVRAGSLSAVLPDHGIRIVFYDTKTRGKYWKWHDAARFELWRLKPDGTLGTHLRNGPKLNYCLRDLRRLTRPDGRHHYPGSPQQQHYPGCSEDPDQRERTLGTSIGWTDAYPWSYPQNWISVRGLRGCFAYVQRADPDDGMQESNEGDNASAVSIRLPFSNRLRDAPRRGCPPVRGSLSPPAGASTR